jgi:hypothetical protein
MFRATYHHQAKLFCTEELCSFVDTSGFPATKFAADRFVLNRQAE